MSPSVARSVISSLSGLNNIGGEISGGVAWLALSGGSVSAK